MAAAAITPTSVQITYLPASKSYGTPIRTVEYLVKLTKVTQSDWIVAATYTPGTYLGSTGYVIDSSGNGAGETMTYAATGTTILMGAATVGTAYLKVLCQTAA
jgi:hypothetical protein